MIVERPISLLILEDDEIECSKFRNYIKNRDDICIIAVTNCELDALKYVEIHKPKAIIVDIELNSKNSTGTGITFLENLKELVLDIRPIIMITTKIYSDLVYERGHQLGADMIFYKNRARIFSRISC